MRSNLDKRRWKAFSLPKQSSHWQWQISAMEISNLMRHESALKDYDRWRRHHNLNWIILTSWKGEEATETKFWNSTFPGEIDFVSRRWWISRTVDYPWKLKRFHKVSFAEQNQKFLWKSIEIDDVLLLVMLTFQLLWNFYDPMTFTRNGNNLTISIN
jgi:hypothetical protein